jgi:mono/diheme cytochrome c family protein
VAPAYAPQAGQSADPRNSYLYYGPNELWKWWNDPENKWGDPQSKEKRQSERLGRDTWIHWTWGNQKFLRRVAVLAGNLPVPISLDFFRVLDSRNRSTRFRDLGFVNEPNCYQNNVADKYGFYLDTWKGDPLHYYPGDPDYAAKYGSTYPGTQRPIDNRQYGRPSGVLGLRLFDNPKFDDAAENRWNINEYFANPGKMEPPYLVGFSCAFCHISFDPNNPPVDPENPRWYNLAANIGNQYFREGELFLGKGRVLFGNKHPLPDAKQDLYRARGLIDEDFLYQYAATQQPGTSETSRISYDFLNNPNTINPIFNLGKRLVFDETSPYGQPRKTMHILKDGSDSVGVQWALMRVPINIGCEGEYWIDRLFNPVTGRTQRPFRIAEVLAGMPADERKELEQTEGINFQDITKERLEALERSFTSEYGKEKFGADWQEAWRRHGHLANYLTSYKPAHLSDAVRAQNPADAKNAVNALPRDQNQLARGAELFAVHCARCHSNRQPKPEELRKVYARQRVAPLTEEDKKWYINSVRAADFRDGNTLTDDVRYSVTELGTNMARSLGTNAVDGDIWAEFSSREYKALPPLGRISLDVPVFQPSAPPPWRGEESIHIEFEPRGGGRGYYRTPSLVSMWATAPYLHNNALGDYYVVKDDGAKAYFPNDGSRVGRRLADGTWVDYRIDVSIEGRLKMFEDAVDKLLNPWKRHRWVKRTSVESSFVPDLESSARQLLVAVAREVVNQELTRWAESHGVPPGIRDEAIRASEDVIQSVAGGIIQEARVSLRFGWSAMNMQLQNHADRLFELVFESLQPVLAEKRHVPQASLTNLKPLLRKAYLDRLESLDRQLREAAVLKIPAGTPVNLYANLGNGAALHAALAHIRYRNDPRQLAKALLELSDCPDLVEDSGHLYGAKEMSPEQKKDLMAFLKTL